MQLLFNYTQVVDLRFELTNHSQRCVITAPNVTFCFHFLSWFFFQEVCFCFGDEMGGPSTPQFTIENWEWVCVLFLFSLPPMTIIIIIFHSLRYIESIFYVYIFLSTNSAGAVYSHEWMRMDELAVSKWRRVYWKRKEKFAFICFAPIRETREDNRMLLDAPNSSYYYWAR